MLFSEVFNRDVWEFKGWGLLFSKGVILSKCSVAAAIARGFAHCPAVSFCAHILVYDCYYVAHITTY